MASPTSLPAAGPLESFFRAHSFDLTNASSWSLSHAALFALCVTAAFEFLARVPAVFSGAGRIEARGRHLDVLERTDYAFLLVNRLASVPFSYHLLKALWLLPGVRWGLDGASLANTLVAVPLLFVAYDGFYALFHRALHLQAVYPLVHKHHHRQHAPSRGNTDAINVHPLEFVVGEYLHLLVIAAASAALPSGVHAAAAAAFVVLGGIAASLNHTRLDVRLGDTALGPLGYAVRAHDVHHRMPKANFGQYTQVWDVLMGSYRPYTEAPHGLKTHHINSKAVRSWQ